MSDTAAIIKKLGIPALNKMQNDALDLFKPGSDLVIHSPTGSGKTLAFLLCALQTIDLKKQGIQLLIISPVRELALQIDSVFRNMGTGHRITCVYGGHSVREEARSLEVIPTVLVGTPGRILDLSQRKLVDLSTVTTLVLDEFDKSLQLGFENEMAAICEELNLKSRILTSATKIETFPSFLQLHNPLAVDFTSDLADDKTNWFYVRTKDTDKMETAFRLAAGFGNESSIFFCNHRDAVDRLSLYFKERGLAYVNFHGGLEQDEREQALIRFRNGTANVLVATDLAARGLDITDVAHVVHFQLPADEKTMIHRNGRTARAGKSGNIHFILSEKEYLPRYLTIEPAEEKLNPTPNIVQPVWETIFFNLGKKDKINKIDLVGFLHQVAELKKEDIGLISVLDHQSFVAVKKSVAKKVITSSAGQKIKKKSVRIGIAH